MKNKVFALVGLALVFTMPALAGSSAPGTPEPGSFYLMGTAVIGGASYLLWKRRKG
jgi:LPXTG-motif cell wall-anchored protein